MSASASIVVATALLTSVAMPASAKDETGVGIGSDDVAAASDADIVVTGSRIATTGFNAPTPVTVVDDARAKALGITNIGDLLNTVPSFRPTTTPSTTGVSIGQVGMRTADLRGLSPTRTLILLDSRRIVPSTALGTVDLNLIPSSLIERSEIVTGGASAAYGSDAVAGVVNLILNKKLDGIRANAQFGVSAQGDGEDYLGTFAFGTGFAGGRGHFILGAEYQDSKAIGDCYTRDWCALEPHIVANATPGVNGVPAQVITRDVHASRQSRGGLITAGPLRGIQFAPDGSTIPFTYGDLVGSTLMVGGSGHGINPFLTGTLIAAPVNRHNFLAHVNFELTDSIDFFAEGAYSFVEGRSFTTGIRDSGSLTIRSDNAFLPDSLRQRMQTLNLTSFSFGKDGYDFGQPLVTQSSKTYRGATGLSGGFGGNWGWDFYYQFGRSDSLQVVDNVRIAANFTRAIDAVIGPNGVPICRSTLTNPANGCAPLNIFGENRFSRESKAYAFGTAVQTRQITQNVLAANLHGELFSTGAGPVAFAAGTEHRVDEVVGDADPISKALGFSIGNGGALAGKIRVTEGYAEIRAPLLKDVSFADFLELNGAARLTSYNTSGEVTTWKAGVVYRPIKALTFRATRSRDIRAPNVSELYSPIVASQVTISDTRLNNQTVVATRTSGNAGLTPEIADTVTAGLVFQPENFLSGLRLSVDYYRIKIKDAVGTLAPQAVVTRCNSGDQDLCRYVTRDPTTQFLSLIEVPYVNLATVLNEGVDINLLYRLPLDRMSNSLAGTLTANVLASYVAHLTTSTSTGSVDVAGQTGCSTTSTFYCVPHWVVDGSLTYDRGPFSATVRTRYISKGVYDPALVGPEDAGYDPSLPNSINTNRVDARLYVNMSVSYSLVDQGSSRVQLFASVENLFDKDPPLLPARGNSVTYDIIGRYYRTGLRVQF